MKSSFYTFLKFFIFSLVPASLFATNVLTVQDPDIWGTKPGYIDKATLVIEPYGGYVEQSLYLTYSDHNQFNQGSKLEIVHRFELPAGSVVNDLWLWIGDSVMQAILMDTWTARSIYDSIVVLKEIRHFYLKMEISMNCMFILYPLVVKEGSKLHILHQPSGLEMLPRQKSL